MAEKQCLCLIVDSFLHSKQVPLGLPSPNTANNSRSASPAISNGGRKSPYQMLPRSATSPLPAPVPSRDLSISQDCAFPPFPTSRSRCATPTTPAEASLPFSTRSKPTDQDEIDRMRAPLNPRTTAGSHFPQKLNSLAQGHLKQAEKGDLRQTGHKKTLSTNNSQDFTRPTSSGSLKSHNCRPSTSSSIYTRNPSVSSTSGSTRYTLDRSRTDVPAVPPMPTPIQPPPQADARDKASEYQSAFDFGSFGLENPSQTFPKGDDRAARSEEKASFHRRPSEPSPHSHKLKPSVAAAAMLPLHEIGSTSSFKPSKSIRGRNRAPTLDPTISAPSKELDGKENKEDRTLSDAPPLPIPANVQSHGPRNPYHTPHESTSSNESYTSGAKTGSSRSSPPLNDSPQQSNFDENPPNNLFDGFQFDVERRPSFEQQVPTKVSPETGYLKPRPAKPTEAARPAFPTLSPYANTQYQQDSPETSPEDYFSSSLSSKSNNLRVSPAPLATRPAPETSSHHRPRTANKGNCRGCGELIKGKSVSSADGRLTGRYHKQCFVCKTCQAPFQTADFYVMDNHPYCARHYHELNDSLCKKCDRGIEGQYLETDDQRQKFHPHCFSCQECHRILRDDYFEWNGRTLCEQHAFRAAQQPSSLGPGRRFPERRTTRLMMM